jgi:DNA-binding NarL/FixJ family response regulator
MPGKEGLETIVEFRRKYPELRIIAVSGAAIPTYLQMARLLGAQMTLMKPVRPSVLLQTVRSLLPATGR